MKDNKNKNTNDFFSQYNLSQDLSINTDVDYLSNDFGVSSDELNVTSEFGEGSQLNCDYGLGTTEYNPETPVPDMPDMMEALDSIKIPQVSDSVEMPDSVKMPDAQAQQSQVHNQSVQSTAADMKAKKEAEAATRHVEDARASYNAHSRVGGFGGANMYAQKQGYNQQTTGGQQHAVNQQTTGNQQHTANARQSQTQRQQTYYNQQASRQAKYERQNTPVLNQEQQYRLKELFTQFYIVNNSKQLAHNVSSWQVLFNEYEDKGDFANIRFVAAIIETLERMEGIDLNVWRYFEQELFRYADNSPQWAGLRNRLQAARSRASKEGQNRGYGNTQPYQNWNNVQQNTTSATYARQQMHMAAKRAQKEERDKKTKWTVIFWVIIVIIVLLWIIGATSESTEPEYDYYYNDEYGYNIDIDYEKLKVEIPTFEIPTFADITWPALEADSYTAKRYRELYGEQSPYEIDINEDDIADKVYFASTTNKWVVSLYNADKDTYDYYGTLEDCKKEYPQINKSYAVSCMVDIKENESATGSGETESAT